MLIIYLIIHQDITNKHDKQENIDLSDMPKRKTISGRTAPVLRGQCMEAVIVQNSTDQIAANINIYY